nr:hypothetical protein [uncultured Chryseobacterium sp.]
MQHIDLKVEIESSVDGLLKLVKLYCRKRITGTIYYIVSDFNEFKGNNRDEQNNSRQIINNSKELLDLDSAVELLNREYHDLYEVSLYIFRAFKKETIIEIQ